MNMISCRPALSYEEHVLQLDGSTTIRDLETRYNIVLRADAGFETLAGFLLYQFGHIPAVKDSVVYGGRRSPSRRNGTNRIATVLAEKLVYPADQPDPLK